MQEAWLRWARVDDAVETPAAYLTRITTLLCLEHIKSARSRRENYVGIWLPEPLMDLAKFEDGIHDDITLPLMLAMERLSPLERAAFLLHDIFNFPLADIAVTLERKPAAVRQLASRARKSL